MDIKFFEIPGSGRNLKATIHASGKMGFTKSAIEELSLDENSYIRLGENVDDTTDDNLYMVILREKTKGALKLNKAGQYYYLNTKNLFDKLDYDYKKRKIMYDIVDIDYEGTKIFKLVRREKDRKKTK